MRMEELANSMYIKSTDSVERYLLELVRVYFENNKQASQTSREYIIQQAVKRMKEEITFEGMGVTSVQLPGNKVLTGAVRIELGDLGGEPWINPKRTAFNVDFGTVAGTACEGNDPRLSDARRPLEHTHQIESIIGLDGILSTITGKVSRIDGMAHKHNNKPVLDMLIYTGDKSTIDLAILDTLEDKVSVLVSQIRDEIARYRNDTDALIDGINLDIDNVGKKIDELKKFIEDKDKGYLGDAKKYTDDKCTALKDEFNNAVNGFIERQDLNPILSSAGECFSLAGSYTKKLADIFDTSSQSMSRTADFSIADTLTEISERNAVLKECQTEFLVQYKDESGRTVCSPIPFITFYRGAVEGTLQMCSTSNSVTVTYTCKTGRFPNILEDASVICNIYSKQEVAI